MSNGGGVITVTPSQAGGGNPALAGVQISPPAALAAGGAWEFVGQAGKQWSGPTLTYQLVAKTGTYQVEFKPLAGWNLPANNPSGSVALGSVVTLQGLYTLLLSWPAPSAITYGTALTSLQLNATTTIAVSGSYSYSPFPPGTVLTPGTYQLSVTFYPGDTVNYASTSATATLAVLPATLTVTAANAFRSYGQPNPALTGDITGLQNGDDIDATYSAPSATVTSPVGTYPIVPALDDPGNLQTNYTVNLINGTLTVTPAPLVVTSNSVSRPYSTPNPVFIGTISGAQNGDVITVNYSTTATAGSPPGSYPITQTVAAPNYQVTYVNGTLTVVAPPPVIQSEQVSGGNIIFTFSSFAGQMYQVQSTTSLAPANWTNIGGIITATSSTTSFSEPIGPSTQFYRVVLCP
jgi:hypothetical protein